MSYTPEHNYTGDITLPEEISSEIWAKALEGSAFLNLCRRIDLPGNGLTVPVITGDPEAAWVGETERAPISNSTFSVKHITPYQMSFIEPVSKKFARDLPGLYEKMLERAPYAIAQLFDSSIVTGAVPGSNFDDLAGVDAFDISEDPYQGFVAAQGAIAAAGYRADKIIIDPTAETLLYASVDDVNRPLFIPSVHDNNIGTVLGRPVSVWRNIHVDGAAASGDDPAVANTVGFMGDWSKAVVGIVQNMTLEIAKEATLTKANGTTIDLFQQGMIAVKLNFEAGFAIEDEDAFAKLTTPYSA